jgi:polar amino acid transport system substrate-binding protein
MNESPRMLIASLCGLVLLGAGPAAAGQPLIVSGHPDYPPVMWEENGTIVGAAAELAKTVFTELGVPFEIRATGPWKRVQLNSREGTIDVIVAAYVNPERLAYMDYTVPFMKDPVVAFVWKGKAFPFRKWDDLAGKLGTTNLGESYEEAFDKFAEQKLNIERVAETVQNFKKLGNGRASYFVFGLYPGLACAAITGYDDKIEVLPQPIVTAEFYMTFSKKSKFGHLIPRVNKIIARLKSQGAIDAWLKKYLKYYKTTRKTP